MSKRHSLLARTAAAVTTMGAALTGAVVLSAAPANAALHETDYTFQASSWGTRVTADQAELRSDRTAWAVLGCTRLAGLSDKETAAEVDTAATGNPMIDIGAVRSTKRTFTNKAKGVQAGVLGTNKIASITLGTQDTPLLTIDGLKSTAKSWVDTNGKFHAQTGLSVADMQLDLLKDTPVDDALQQLLDAIQTQVLDNVISVLANHDGAVEIPGLGVVYLPGDQYSFRKEIVRQKKGTAQASVKALRIVLYGSDGVEGGGDDSEIVIGRAWSRISKAPAGVMLGHGYGVSAQVADGLIGVGRVAFQPLQCWGTDGTMKQSTTAGIDLLNTGYVTTGNILGRALGSQFNDGSAVARTVGKVAGITITDGDTNYLGIDAIKSVVNVKQKANGKLAKGFPNIDGSKIVGVTLNGEDQGEILPGDTIEIPGVARIVFLETRDLPRGLEVIGAHVYVLDGALSDAGLVDVKLGVSKARIKRY